MGWRRIIDHDILLNSWMEMWFNMAVDEGVLTRLANRPQSIRPFRAHFVGIAGSGMAALVQVLLDRSWQLTGSDLQLAPVQYLAAQGVCLHSGHAANQLPDAVDVVIRSDAIPLDNPELQLARQRGIPIASYYQMVGQLMGMKGCRGLAIAGTHGKSTTTAMTAEILVHAGLNPTVLCGATPLSELSGGRAGRNDLMLVEACEHLAHFLHLRPELAVILDIEPDHFDYYHSLDEIETAFAQFVANMPPHGRLLVRHECAAAHRAASAARCKQETFGLSPQADWFAQVLTQDHGRYTFEIFHCRTHWAQVTLRVPGMYNVLNALAAAAASHYQGVNPATVATALGQFAGLKRRLQHLGSFRDVELLDDYAHHPTEVRATLTAVQQIYPERRVWCVFQPHQASRTARLLDEFATSLENSDNVLVADIYRAREPTAVPGEVTAADLAHVLRMRGKEVPAVHSLDAIAQWLMSKLAAGDVLITMGAGDINSLYQRMNISL